MKGLFANIGHRGYPLAEPENTISSFLRAFEAGATAVEMDVRVTADGHLVLMHDETVDRTTNGHGYIEKMTLRELKSLKVGGKEEVPTLSEAVKAIKGKGGIDVDLKVSGYARELLNTLKEVIDFVYITSESTDALSEILEEEPDVRTGLIFDENPYDKLEVAKELGVNAIVPRLNLLERELVSLAKEGGLEVFVWTVNSEEEALKALSLGVDGLITDNPPLIADLLRRFK